MNVYSRKPLEAERHAANVTDKGEVGAYYWSVAVPGIEAVMRVRGVDRQVQSDAEFAEHFYPAERLDTLIAAVADRVESDGYYVGGECNCSLCETWRAFREQA